MWYHDVLGVSAMATLAECKSAYRKLCCRHHPDVGGDVETFQRINKAWEAVQHEDKVRQRMPTRPVKQFFRHVSIFNFVKQ